MKRIFAVLLAVFLLAGLAAPCSANEMVKLILSTPGLSAAQAKEGVQAEELEDAIKAGQELIPAECKLDPERITVMQTGVLTCDAEDAVGTFKVWSTVNRTIGLFFLAEDSEDWVLLSCNLGDVIEAEFTCSGTYAIVVGW